MEHVFEERVLIGEEGKKRHRGENLDQSIKDDSDIEIVRSRSLLENNLLLSAAAKRQAIGHNGNFKLECPWFGEPTDYSKASTNAEDTYSPNGLPYGDEDK
ncbi:putative protein isoform X1 [Gossypium australe]|uniref:Uncharacterized protein n=1 Tax=Gossypium australe TaxID=47621 RepID=A0A5B6WJT7_9ROSI|nr:putative protein isoform X1 [Gossypium australe]